MLACGALYAEVMTARGVQDTDPVSLYRNSSATPSVSRHAALRKPPPAFPKWPKAAPRSRTSSSLCLGSALCGYLDLASYSFSGRCRLVSTERRRASASEATLTCVLALIGPRVDKISTL